MSGKNKSSKTNGKIRNVKSTRSKTKSKAKPIIIGGVCAVLLVVAIVCAIIFIPKAIDKDADYPSSYPDYFSNLKEEKEVFSKALDTCNKAAEAKLASKGIKTEYRETNLDIINKYVGFNDRINAAYVELGVDPTGGDTDYKNYGKRSYHCYAHISGTSVYEISIIWDEKND